MTGVKSVMYRPNKKAANVYAELYSFYRQLHDAFGLPNARVGLDRVMKDLIALRHRVRHEG
jgi:L-ribulokinase